MTRWQVEMELVGPTKWEAEDCRRYAGKLAATPEEEGSIRVRPARTATPADARGRRGDWVLTYTGTEFWPIDPRPEEIWLRDIVHALSMMCRFSGHVSQFYSVAEHCVRVAWLVPPKDRLWALLHDASEAYLLDLVRPLKRHTEIGRLYREAERVLMAQICERFGLPVEEPASVKRADEAMLCVEARALLPVNSWWAKHAHCLIGNEPSISTTWAPAAAERLLLGAIAEAMPEDVYWRTLEPGSPEVAK